MSKVIEIIIAAILGSVVTMAVSWLLLGSKVRVLRTLVSRLNQDLTKCQDSHVGCADSIRGECHTSVKNLADVVDDLTKTTSLISATLNAHLQVSQQLDAATEQRFSRIEVQLTRIESKLDQLKGWRIVEDKGGR